MKPHLVRQGEYLARLCAERGLDPAEVWNHPKNAALRERRRSPEVLASGDLIFLPEPSRRPHRLDLRSQNHFTAPVSRIPVRVRLVMAREALSREPCLVEGVGPEELAVFSDGDGWVEFTVPSHIEHVTLVLPARDRRIGVRIGHLDPVDTPSGLAQRLENLGYLQAGWSRLPDAERDSRVRSALIRFQAARSLPATGTPDDATRRALEEAHAA